MPRLSIIVPIYNEEQTLADMVKRIKSVAVEGIDDREIILVDDGSTDKTPHIAKSFVDHQVIYVHQQHAGKTAALMQGFARAQGDILLIQDADCEYDPRFYSALLAPILRGETHIVYGSRFKGQIKGMEPINRWANQISNQVFSWAYGFKITDINTGFKVMKREVMQDLTIESKGFAFETEITIKLLKKGYSIREVPIDYTARTRLEGKKMHWIAALEMFWPIIYYKLKG